MSVVEGRMQVDFMMIGAQKSGTTGLAAQLAAHPEICFSRIKEPAFFNEVEAWRERLDEYEQLFEPRPGQLLGEASTMYTFLPEWPETPSRLFEYNPDLKLIYIMRQPVERIVSQYAHNYVRGLVKDEPEMAVTTDPTYINRSRYGVQIRPYLELFGPENMLLLIFEEYIADPDGTLAQVARFLDLDPAGFPNHDTHETHQSTGRAYLKYDTVRKLTHSPLFQSMRSIIPATIRQPLRRRLSNQIDAKPIFSAELKHHLWRFVEDDVYTIEKVMGRPLTIWREGYTQ